MSLGNFGVILLNLLSGGIVDYCRRKSENDKIGTSKGLTITTSVLATFSTLMSIFAIFRNKWAAHLAVASLLCARGFASLWVSFALIL